MKATFLAGRVILGGFFLYNGVNHLLKRKDLTPYAASKGVPAPDAGVVISGVALMVGGLSLITGVKPRYGSAAIIGFLAGVSPIMHDFWSQKDPQQRMGEMVHFSKNMALLGATLALAGMREPWPYSLRVVDEGPWDRVRRTARELVD